MGLQRINITLDDTQLTYLDEFCKKEERNRSQLIKLALRDYFINYTGKKQTSSLPQSATDPILATASELHRCQVPNFFCKITKTKKYGITFLDADGNEKNEEIYLCDNHLQRVKQSKNEVIEL